MTVPTARPATTPRTVKLRPGGMGGDMAKYCDGRAAEVMMMELFGAHGTELAVDHSRSLISMIPWDLSDLIVPLTLEKQDF